MDGETSRTCAEWGLDRIVVVTPDPEAPTAAREWADSVVDDGGEVHELDGADVGSVFEGAVELDADLLVVGAPSDVPVLRHRAANLVRSVIHRADRPVAIIGPRVQLPMPHQDTVVAGVGSGPATDASVPWAACFAERHGCHLALVGTVPNRPAIGPDGLVDVIAFYLDRGVLAEWKSDDLARWADDLREITASNIDISEHVETGRPGPHLVNAAVDAAAVVMGRHAFRRDHRALHRPLRYVLDHAEWPVVVVPPEGGRRRAR